MPRPVPRFILQFPLRRTVKTLGAFRCLAAVILAGSAHFASAGVLDDVFGPDDKNWVEVGPETPAPPEPRDLLEFYVSPTTQFHFAIDSRSLTVGPDGVVHYVLVATSSSGARNTSFEGMRCATRELKIYAYLAPNNTFMPRDDPTWKRIDEADANRQRAALFKDYFCANGVPTRTDIIRALKGNPYDSIPK